MSRIIYAVVTVASFLSSLVTILGWFRITPETVGETAYQIMYIAFPIISSVCGLVAGWCARSWLYENKKFHAHDWFMAEAFPEMPFDAKEYLCAIYEKGAIDLDGDLSRFFKDIGIRDYVRYETIGPNEYRWSLVSWVRKEFDRHKGALDDVRKPAIPSS